MRSFKTPKGTELPLIDLKGKDYLQVAYRLVWFREDHPHGKIDTERLSESDKQVTYRATISIRLPEREYELIKISNADKTINIKSTLDYEKCETAAVGRALAMAGYGTQFAEDIQEGEDIADAPIDQKPQSQASSLMDRGGPSNEDSHKFTIGKHSGKTFKEVLLIDSGQEYNYTNWLYKQKQDIPDKLHKDQLLFLSYAMGKGIKVE